MALPGQNTNAAKKFVKEFPYASSQQTNEIRPSDLMPCGLLNSSCLTKKPSAIYKNLTEVCDFAIEVWWHNKNKKEWTQAIAGQAQTPSAVITYTSVISDLTGAIKVLTQNNITNACDKYRIVIIG